MTLLGFLLARDAHGAPSPLANEYTLKATYLFKFAGFVDWPAASFASPTSPFVITIVGDDPFGEVLDRVVAGQRVLNRPIQIRRVPASRAGPEGQVVFVAERDEDRRKAVLERLAGQPVLTVGEEETFLREGGMIRLLVAEDRLRFEVNKRATDQVGLKVSSKLLALAARVFQRGQSP